MVVLGDEYPATLKNPVFSKLDLTGARIHTAIMSNNPKQAPEWPRDVTIRPTEEVALKLIGDKYGNNPDSEGFLYSWGYELYSSVEIDGWQDLKLEDGYELALESDRAEYRAYRESKRGRADRVMS
jgi:hypothetical protein